MTLDPFGDEFWKFEQNFDRNEKSGSSHDFSSTTCDDSGRLISPKKRARPNLGPITTRFYGYLGEKPTFFDFSII